MSSATWTSPPIATARLVVDTDAASFIFKWHPESAPRYVDIVRRHELIVSFMTVAEMRQGALDTNWGPRKCAVLEAYLADFSVLPSDSLLLLHLGRRSEREHAKGTPVQFGRRLDCIRGTGTLSAADSPHRSGVQVGLLPQQWQSHRIISRTPGILHDFGWRAVDRQNGTSRPTACL